MPRLILSVFTRFCPFWASLRSLGKMWLVSSGLPALILVSSVTAGRAQAPVVRGEIRDAATAYPLPGAVVRWLPDDPAAPAPTLAAVSDGTGRFVLARPARAATRVVAQALGYAPDTLAVAAAGSPYLRAALRPGAALGEVTVITRAPAYSALTPTNTQVISSRDLTKSACCNLAESFETNAAVEVTTADAVSGAKQIQLLGLDGAYSLLTIDNQPALRGLAAPYRLGYLAGPWIESIEIIKGTGSVVNGYEAMSGQVNVKLKEPENTDQLLLNAYANDLGKTDFNLNASARLSPKWSTALLLHTDHLGQRTDRNADGFLDLPLATQLNAFNKWKYKGNKGLVSEIGLGALRETRQGGQLAFREDEPDAYLRNYGTTQGTRRYTAYAKTSYTWPTRPFQSLGLLMTGTSHDFNSTYSFGYERNHNPLRTARRYDGTQRTGQATLLFQSVLNNTAHTYRTGLSFLYDDFQEFFGDGRVYLTESPAETYAREHPARRELVPGAFAEYSYQNSRNLTVVFGLRADRHNLYGWQVTPRFNLKLDATESSIFRLSAGSGFRTPNPIADNAAIVVSARDFNIAPGLLPEKSWNVGGSFTQYFRFGQRQATFVADYYHTEFGNQLVADMYTAPQYLLLDNLVSGGRSFARSLQTEVQIEPLKNLQIKASYKFLDVQTSFDTQRLPKPLTPRHRSFLNLAYATAFDKWRADATVQWFGARPLAHIDADHQHGTGVAYELDYTPRFATLNAQLTRAFKRLEVYAGVENLTNYRQANPIDGAANPFGPAFDAAMVWGPVFGSLTYVGARYRIQ